MTQAHGVKEVSAGYGELALVEMPAIDLLTSLGWSFKNLYAETFGELGSEGRESESQVILIRRLRAALVALNPGLPADAYGQAIEQLAQDRSKHIAVNANRDLYRLLKDGVKVKVPDEHGGHSTETLRVIDWATPANNEFFLASQMWVAGDMYRRRCDLLGFVNGLPLVFIELKKPAVPLKSAFDDNLRDYRGQSVPQLFHPNAFILLSNGSDTKVGTLTSGWEHFFDWKRVADEGEAGKVSLERALRGLLEPARLLDYIENFTVFEEGKGGLVKKTAKNHQVLGVNKSIARLVELRETEKLERKRLGVFWHTQGSGKSLSMVFFTQKVLRKVLGSCTFVIVTDREELDDQISKTFKATGATAREDVRATSGEHLKKLLQGNERYIFTLIQKFRNEPGQPYPMLSDRSDVIVITDEAHRSQYDIFALNMRNALPHAGFIGFTGTPLLNDDKHTLAEFGGQTYIDEYRLHEAVADGATLPIKYQDAWVELMPRHAEEDAPSPRPSPTRGEGEQPQSPSPLVGEGLGRGERARLRSPPSERFHADGDAPHPGRHLRPGLPSSRRWGQVRVADVAAGEGLEAVARRIPGIDRAAARDAVARRPDIDRDLVLRHDVAGAQHLFPAVHQERAVVQLAWFGVIDEGDVVDLLAAREPQRDLGLAIRAKHALDEIEAEDVDEDALHVGDIGPVKQRMIEADGRNAGLALLVPRRGIDQRHAVSDRRLGRIKFDIVAGRQREAHAAPGFKEVARREAGRGDAGLGKLCLEGIERRFVADLEAEEIDPGALGLAQHDAVVIALVPALEIDPARCVSAGFHQAQNIAVEMNRGIQFEHAHLRMTGPHHAFKSHLSSFLQVGQAPRRRAPRRLRCVRT